MMVHVLKEGEHSADPNDYDLVTVVQVDDCYQLLKMLEYMRLHDIPLVVGESNRVDHDGKYYDIENVSMVFPMFGGDLVEHLAVYVSLAVYV